MEYLEKVGLLAHCVAFPVVWGLLTEWIFHVIRTRRRGRGAGLADDLALPEPMGWSCQL